jgi:hypothetical protein
MVDQCGMDISDTIRLSKQDKHSIYKRLKQLKNYKWTLADAKKLNFQDISLISIDSREYIIEYDIIPPIYFQDNKYCIFSFDYGCGGLCGHGEIAIYEKTKHGWRIWTLLTEWDS